MKEITKDLKSSPIYNMSQDSLENFHTSFLCWLGNTYPIAFKKLFNKFNKKRFDKKHSCETQKTHTYKDEDDKKKKSIRTDLEFQFNDNELIVIENKMKSFPNDEQLERYSNIKDFDKEKTTFILLSLVEKINLPEHWNYMSYSDLAKNMKRIFKHEKGYHKYLIQDYINVITKISKIFFEADNIEKEKYDLRDIFVKFKTSELSNYINEKINKKYNWEIEESFSTKCKEGIIDIIKNLDKSIRFQIQIQGNHYSYGFVYSEKNPNDKIWKKREQIAEELLKRNYWFVGTSEPKKPRICKKFYSYSPDFIYRHSSETKLNELTYKQIIKKIKKDIKNFEKNLVKIQKCISKFVK